MALFHVVAMPRKLSEENDQANVRVVFGIGKMIKIFVWQKTTH